MAERIYMNDNWMFNKQFQQEMKQTDFDETQMETIRIPHTFQELPFHYFDESLYQMEGGYRKCFQAEQSWIGKKVYLTFEGSAHETEVFLNGKRIGQHSCGYTAFSIELTNELQYHTDNVLAIRVDSRENLNIPPFGHAIDYMSYGGIYRNVYLEITSQNHIKDLFLKPEVSQEDGGPDRLLTEIEIELQVEQVTICQSYRIKGKSDFTFLGEEKLGKDFEGESIKTKLSFPIDNVELWSPKLPNLYEIKTQLCWKDEIFDESIVCIGFRTAEFREDGFYLTGKKETIRGLNRHQSYPYVGYAMPDSMQRLDADILKYELGLNAVRTSHYPQSHAFISRCDEIGLMVFMEIPGWQHIGDESWKNQAIKNTEDMVKQYRNHTSIILWGVRINESKDDDTFYQKTNEVAKKLDNTRPTAGVRAHKKSSLLEDVYTYNDFSHAGGKKVCNKKKRVTPNCKKAYLVSEYNGHMYPTKSFDSAKHRTEHAIRHAKVLNAIMEQPDIAGSFGWCFADYNTHKDFGSGDRICYHGVLDMFRNFKVAADVYASQQDRFPVLNVTTSFDMGEQAGCVYGKEWIITNADEVHMYKNDILIKTYKKEMTQFKAMEHGPILIDDFVGKQIDEETQMKRKQKKIVSQLLNDIAKYGMRNLPPNAYLTMLKLIVFYRIKPTDIQKLYEHYIGNWGGLATKYRFDAVQNNHIVKSIQKTPMNQISLELKISHQTLIEKSSYDVAAIRIRAVDENGNLLSYYQGALKLQLDGPLNIIGPDIITLQGGMAGIYLKTIGMQGEAVLHILNEQIPEMKVQFKIEIDR